MKVNTSKSNIKTEHLAKEIAIVASNGNLVQEVRYLTRFAAQVIVESDGKLFSGYNASGYSVPLDRFLKLANIGSTALSAAKRPSSDWSACLARQARCQSYYLGRQEEP